MTYTIQIKKQAKKKLESLPRTLRARLTEKIMTLGLNPDSKELGTKHLAGSPFYRMRVGDWRIVYDRDNELKIISIERIKARGDVYK